MGVPPHHITWRHKYAVNLEVLTVSRKDFVAIAAAIRENINDAETRRAVAAALLPALRASNQNFRPDKFLAAAVGE
jgi:hypothetical protein